jgi:hypothetical protein
MVEITETVEAGAAVDVADGVVTITIRDVDRQGVYQFKADATGARKLAALLKAAATTSDSRAAIREVS